MYRIEQETEKEELVEEMKHKAEQYEFNSAGFVKIQPIVPMAASHFKIVDKSIFDCQADALVNSINCVGVMGAGIALEFKKKYPDMFRDYQVACSMKKIRPGDCYIYHDDEHHIYLLGLAVKNDWRQWSTLEWLESSIKSLKLVLLENDIKSVNLPVIGGMNGRRGPQGKVVGMTPPPEKEKITELIQKELEPFANKFHIDINLCIPSGKPKSLGLTLTEFFES